jgi:hypothetical protein
MEFTTPLSAKIAGPDRKDRQERGLKRFGDVFARGKAVSQRGTRKQKGTKRAIKLTQSIAGSISTTTAPINNVPPTLPTMAFSRSPGFADARIEFDSSDIESIDISVSLI